MGTSNQTDFDFISSHIRTREYSKEDLFEFIGRTGQESSTDIHVLKNSKLARILKSGTESNVSIALIGVTGYSFQPISFIHSGKMVCVPEQETMLAVCNEFFDGYFREPSRDYKGYFLTIDCPAIEYPERIREKYGGSCLFRTI